MFYQRLLSGNNRFLFSRRKTICYNCRIVIMWLPFRVIALKPTAQEFSKNTRIDTQDTVPRKSRDVENERRNRVGDHRSQASEVKSGMMGGRARRGTGEGRTQQRQTGWWSKSENGSASEGRWRVQREEQGRGTLHRNVAATNVAWRSRRGGGYEFLFPYLCALPFRHTKHLLDENNKKLKYMNI